MFWTLYSILLDHTDGNDSYYCAFHNDFLFLVCCSFDTVELCGTSHKVYLTLKVWIIQVKLHVLTTKTLQESHDQRHASAALCLTSVCTLMLVCGRPLDQSANVKMSFCFEKVCYCCLNLLMDKSWSVVTAPIYCKCISNPSNGSSAVGTSKSIWFYR